MTRLEPTINYRANQLVQAGIDSMKTFGKHLTPAKQVEELTKYTMSGITVYFNDGDWMVYRILK